MRLPIFCIIFALSAGFIFADNTDNLLPDKPLTLDACVKIALTNHPSCQAAKSELDSAIAGITAAKAAILPQVGVDGSYNHDSVNTQRDGTTVGVNVKQLIFDGGRTEAYIRDSEAQKAVKSAAYRQVENSVVFEVRRAYYETLAAERIESAVSQSFELTKIHLKAAQARYNEGQSPKSDVTRAQVEMARSELELIRARNNIKLAYAGLGNAMGISCSEKIQLSNEFRVDNSVSDITALIKEGLRKRPEIQLAEAQVMSALMKKQVSTAANSPEVYATAGYDWLSASSRSANGLFLGMGVKYSLWDGGEKDARIKQTSALAEAAKFYLSKTANDIDLEIRQSLMNIHEADERITVSAALIEQADENYRIANGRYKANLGSMIEVVDAETSLTQARISEIEAIRDSLTARAKIELAVGRDYISEGTQ